MRPIIDSHLDLAWNAISWKRDLTQAIEAINRAEAGMTDRRGRGHATTCLPELRRGQVAVCLGTMMARVPYGELEVHGDTLDFPSHEQAYAYAQGQRAYYQVLVECGQARWIRTQQELKQHWTMWTRGEDEHLRPPGIVLAMEGSDAIISPTQAEKWFADGLRVASLVHYGRSQYAAGTGAEGPLTPAGRKLLCEFERVGMILDVTHLCDTSFFEALDAFGGPVLASHQNCRALVSGERQFSDQQIDRIIERGGVLGIAFDAWMLYPGWQRADVSPTPTSREVVTLDAAADHVDYICQRSGDCRHVAIGSDLDGGFGTEQTPTGLDTIADLQKLGDILSARGYADADIDAVFWGNWLEFFLRHLPSE